jgi:hypothetical protein
MNNTLDDYADSVYEHFTTLPESLPSRVYDLARELTEDCATDYQRVKAIEDYLVTFPYTLTPQALSTGADFVDHFLFEGKEGYCTYYASAMAVMARCLGIPSRYSEGYVLPAVRDEDGLFTVTNQQAHAWAEVYLEGYGWLALEPTAPYHSTMENPGVAAPLDPGLFPPSYLEDPAYLEYLRNIGYDNSYLLNLPAVNDASGRSFTEVLLEILPWLGLTVLALILLALCFLLVQRIREALRFASVNRMPLNEQACAFFKGITKITQYYNYPQEKRETSYMYCKRLGKRFAFQNDTLVMLDLARLYYKAGYGGKPITEAELELMRSCYYEMATFLRRMRLRPHFIYLRYVRRVTVI